MKQNPDFLLREVAGKMVLVPVGAAASKFPGMVTLNRAGKLIWELLAQEQTLQSIVDAMTERYEVSREQAAQDAEKFLARLRAVEAIMD